MRILVAEDEKSMSRALCAILEKSGYSADPVYDGQDALDYIEAGNYDAVLLDIMMPKLDGLTVLKRVREAGNTVPVLMLTAKGEVDDKVAGLDGGANDYLTKPFATKELLARLRAMTRAGMSAAQAADSTLRVGNITLNRASNELTGPEGSFVLANREFQMLELMMSNPGNILSTEHLLEKIWGFDTEVEVNVVWVYISNLRKKLKKIGADVQIKASRNAGYSLDQS